MEHALSPISTNEIVGILSIQTRSLILCHHILRYEWVLEVVQLLLLWRFQPHLIVTFFQRECVLVKALRSDR